MSLVVGPSFGDSDLRDADAVDPRETIWLYEKFAQPTRTAVVDVDPGHFANLLRNPSSDSFASTHGIREQFHTRPHVDHTPAATHLITENSITTQHK